MKILNTQGITYFEKLYGSFQWYWGTNYIHGDLLLLPPHNVRR
jgi:hypothetical protein